MSCPLHITLCGRSTAAFPTRLLFLSHTFPSQTPAPSPPFRGAASPFLPPSLQGHYCPFLPPFPTRLHDARRSPSLPREAWAPCCGAPTIPEHSLKSLLALVQDVQVFLLGLSIPKHLCHLAHHAESSQPQSTAVGTANKRSIRNVGYLKGSMTNGILGPSSELCPYPTTPISNSHVSIAHLAPCTTHASYVWSAKPLFSMSPSLSVSNFSSDSITACGRGRR